MNINTFELVTHMGAISNVQDVMFLDKDEIVELNSIGYSGKLVDGTPSTKHDFLNSLNKGEFAVQQTGFDNGNFTERFTITRVTK